MCGTAVLNLVHNGCARKSSSVKDLGVKRQIMAVRVKVRSTAVLNLEHNGCARTSSSVEDPVVKRQIMALCVKVRPSRIHVLKVKKWACT